MTHKRRKRVKTLRDGLRAYFPSECVIHERNKFAAVVFSQLDSPVFVVPARFNGRRVIRVGLAVAPSTELEATPGLARVLLADSAGGFASFLIAGQQIVVEALV